MKLLLFYKKTIITLILSFLLTFCSSFSSKDEENSVIKKKRFEPNIKQAQRDAADKGGVTLFGSKPKEAELGQNNVLWKATLSSLDFIPLANATYSGGVIVTDWYSPQEGSNKSIKISVTFLSPELSSTSIQVNSFEKICEQNNCKISKLNNNFSSNIKSKILAKARELKIKQESINKK